MPKHKMTKVSVDSLDFKHLMRALHAGNMVQYCVDDKSLTACLHIGLTESFDNDGTLTPMHPVLSDRNPSRSNPLSGGD